MEWKHVCNICFNSSFDFWIFVSINIWNVNVLNMSIFCFLFYKPKSFVFTFLCFSFKNLSLFFSVQQILLPIVFYVSQKVKAKSCNSPVWDIFPPFCLFLRLVCEDSFWIFRIKALRSTCQIIFFIIFLLFWLSV